MSSLHYIFDPFCGWCYGAAPLIEASRTVPNLQIVLHAGGMLTDANRRYITPQWHDYVIPHDRRIAALTGQPFGEAYFEGLLRDTTAMMDSKPPITAILAAEETYGRGLAMLHNLQYAHYVEGRRIADDNVLQAIANQMGLEPHTFADVYQRLRGSATDTHIEQSRTLLRILGGQGFPTIALHHQGNMQQLDIAAWLGRPDAWKAYLNDLVSNRLESAQNAGQTDTVCGPDQCAIPTHARS